MVLLAAAFLAGQLFATLGIVPTSGVWVLAALGTAILARRGAPRLEPASRALAAAVLASWSGPGLEPATRDCWLPADDAVAKRWIVATVVERVVPTEPLRVTVAATLDGAEGKAVCGSTRLSLRTTPPVPLHP